MKAVVVDEARNLIEQEVEQPSPQGHDVLVKVQAISINPVDLKRVELIGPTDPSILGYDAVGTVVEVGLAVTKYQVGDVIFYAGDNTRAGSYAEYQLVDERITALAPTTISASSAAALPLTWLTAYEILIDKLHYLPQSNANHGTILVINGAGGVGSILTQLAHWLGLKVLATSSPQNFSWLRQNQTDLPLDYHQDLVAQVHDHGIEHVDAVANLFDTAAYLPTAVELLRPFGKIVNIAAVQGELDLNSLRAKSLSFEWELMFTKTHYHYQIETQGQALELLAQLVDRGIIQSTVKKVITAPLTAATIKKAHEQLRQHQMVGKLVVDFQN